MYRKELNKPLFYDKLRMQMEKTCSYNGLKSHEYWLNPARVSDGKCLSDSAFNFVSISFINLLPRHWSQASKYYLIIV